MEVLNVEGIGLEQDLLLGYCAESLAPGAWIDDDSGCEGFTKQLGTCVYTYIYIHICTYIYPYICKYIYVYIHIIDCWLIFFLQADPQSHHCSPTSNMISSPQAPVLAWAPVFHFRHRNAKRSEAIQQQQQQQQQEIIQIQKGHIYIYINI